MRGIAAQEPGDREDHNDDDIAQAVDEPDLLARVPAGIASQSIAPKTAAERDRSGCRPRSCSSAARASCGLVKIDAIRSKITRHAEQPERERDQHRVDRMTE